MRKIFCAATLVSLSFLTLTPTPKSQAEPILKPKKYHGPIPRKAVMLGVGFLAGADNEDMWRFLDEGVPQPLQSFTDTEDFSSALQLDLAYLAKTHPNFAVRLKGGVAFLTSQSTGKTTSTLADTTVIADFERTFDVTLLSAEATGLYFFQDASVQEFQVYVGGGFGLFVPLAEYKQTTTDEVSGIQTGERTVSDNSTAPSVHGVIGTIYHFRREWALGFEGRMQLAQSKFTLTLPTIQGTQPVSFDVDYTGFVLAATISRFF